MSNSVYTIEKRQSEEKLTKSKVIDLPGCEDGSSIKINYYEDGELSISWMHAGIGQEKTYVKHIKPGWVCETCVPFRSPGTKVWKMRIKQIPTN